MKYLVTMALTAGPVEPRHWWSRPREKAKPYRGGDFGVSIRGLSLVVGWGRDAAKAGGR